MTDPIDLTGKTVIVTGASSGIGASTARVRDLVTAVLDRYQRIDGLVNNAGDGIAVSLLLPSITATEFGDGMFTLGRSPRPGMVVHGPEQPGLAR